MKESTNAPKKIYLQHECCGDNPYNFDMYWTEEQIYENDVVYLPAEKVREMLEGISDDFMDAVARYDSIVKDGEPLIQDYHAGKLAAYNSAYLAIRKLIKERFEQL